MNPAAVVTHRTRADLPNAIQAEIVSLPPLKAREGFLALNSVMSMAVSMIRAYQGDGVLPGAMRELDREDALSAGVRQLLVLHPPTLAAAAADLETRLVEIGLASVQTADYRNFAHGRHTGLSRNLGDTAVLVLSDRDSIALADATAAVLTDHADVARWHSEECWPAANIPHLVASMRLCLNLGSAVGLDPAHPKVPVFGRKLYRLPIRTRLPEIKVGAVDRKIRELGGRPPDTFPQHAYEAALEQWVSSASSMRFGGLVLDYDGTVCATDRRFDLPEAGVVDQLNDLLDAGLRIGFASGRGPSLTAALRDVIPEVHWPNIEVGLYNGGVIFPLDEDPGDLKEPSPLISSAAERVLELPFSDSLMITPRKAQLTVELEPRRSGKASLLREMIVDVMARSPALGVLTVGSGHSVDVVPSDTSKVAVADRIRGAIFDRELICIGDQGQLGGNDFVLLGHTKWSLTVDRSSVDPTRCWYLGTGDLSGPRLLTKYLRSIVPRRDGFAFKAGRLL
jgi:hypothetical protein